MPRVIDHETYREEILLGCYELFARRGYGNLTMRELARETGLSTGSLYHYFPSKEAIFEEMLAWLGRRDVRRAIAQIPPGAGPAERLRSVLAFAAGHEADLCNLLLLALDYRRTRPEEGARAVQAVLAIYKTALREQLGGSGAPTDFLFHAIVGLIVGRFLDPAVDFQDQAGLIFACLQDTLNETNLRGEFPA